MVVLKTTTTLFLSHSFFSVTYLPSVILTSNTHFLAPDTPVAVFSCQWHHDDRTHLHDIRVVVWNRGQYISNLVIVERARDDYSGSTLPTVLRAVRWRHHILADAWD